MASTAHILDLSELPASARREVRDFYQFVLDRRKQLKKRPKTKVCSYHFADLCGSLSWKGDAVAAQRKLRDEW